MESAKSCRILIVDDDVTLQSALKRAAEAAGFEVTQAFDGAPGLALAVTERFDLVLLDINMPTTDGRDVLQRLKQNPATNGIPVLICSGRDGQYDRRVGFELGAEDYIEKPVEPTLLMTKIRYVIERTAERRAQR